MQARASSRSPSSPQQTVIMMANMEKARMRLPQSSCFLRSTMACEKPLIRANSARMGKTRAINARAQSTASHQVSKA